MSACRSPGFRIGSRSPTRFTRLTHSKDFPGPLLFDVDTILDSHLLAPRAAGSTRNASLKAARRRRSDRIT